MRITKDRLISLAKNFVMEETYRDKQIACIFLTGSALGEHFLLNNTTDIDLVMIHRSKTQIERKTIRISNQVHYDCWTYPIQLFQDAKTLRMNSWIGSSFCGETLLLYDEGHWFDFQQAAIFSKFFQSETRYLRCKPLLDKARTKWLLLDSIEEQAQLDDIVQYVETLENLGNILSGLVHFPLPIRRFVLQLSENAAMLEKPGLAPGLFDLFSPTSWENFHWSEWIADWQTLYHQISALPDCPPAFQSFRMDYYLQPILLYQEDLPQAGLWISLKTMLDGLVYLNKRNIIPEIDPELILSRINLGQSDFPKRMEELDTYLDAVEMTVESWAKSQGILM